MIRSVIVMLLITQTSFLASQNLVPNPSFEDTVHCPAINFISGVKDWVSVSSTGTPDYFNACDSFNARGAGVPYNARGYQNASTGNAYCGIGSSIQHIHLNFREAIGAELITPLTIGTKYFLSMKVNLSIDSMGATSYATSNIGMRLSTMPYSDSNDVPVDNFAHIYSKDIITDSANWTTISGSIIADSAYSFISLGNFFTNDSIDSVKIGPHWNQFSLYFVDDIWVSQDSVPNFSENVGFQENNSPTQIKLYPNPISSHLNILLEERIKLSKITIVNTIGKVVWSNESNYSQSEPIEINLSKLPSGIYFLQLTSSEGIPLRTEKFIKS